MALIPKTTEELLTSWHRRLRETQFCHYEAAKPLAHANYWLGVPVVILTTFVGTSVFATLEKQVELRIRILIGIVSVGAAVLASLQTFLRLSERAEKHRTVAAHAGSVRREIEQLLAIQSKETITQEKLDRLRAEIDKIAEDAPSVRDRTWARAKKMLYETADDKRPAG
jgi:hypothetical protein